MRTLGVGGCPPPGNPLTARSRMLSFVDMMYTNVNIGTGRGIMCQRPLGCWHGNTVDDHFIPTAVLRPAEDRPSGPSGMKPGAGRKFFPAITVKTRRPTSLVPV